MDCNGLMAYAGSRLGDGVMRAKRKRRRIVIFSGGRLGKWALRHIAEEDTLVGADRGARFLVGHGYRPRLAIGDFDSVRADELERIKANSDELIDCDPVYKDYTDTEMAVVWALEQQPDELLLVGVLGTRMDHALANVHLLRKAWEAGVNASIVDDRNRIAVTGDGRPLAVKQGPYSHVSLLPLSLEVTGITLAGFQYPLERATLRLGQSLGISNVLLAEEGTVTAEHGLLLVIQSRD